MHEINGVATEQGEERLADCRRQRRRAGRGRVNEENENQLRNYDPRDHAHRPPRPVGALKLRVISTVRDDDVDPLQVLEATAERGGREEVGLLYEERIAG